jgi:hypothetical protein
MLRRDLLWGLDPVRFACEALGFHPDSTQARVLRSTGLRLLLNCTRQWGKSTTAAALALHRALYYSNSLILLVSPSQRQSAELFAKIDGFLKTLSVIPVKVKDSQFSMRLGNGSRIVALPGQEKTIRGFSGVTLIIEDEASRVDDALYRALRPMVAVSRGRILLMSTPYGQTGHFFEEWTNGNSWERVECKATDCPRIPQQFLEEERASLGEWWFRQEYLCEFVQTRENVFSYELVMSAIRADIKPLFEEDEI